MKKSEAFRQAQIAVLGADMPISAKCEIIKVLLWEEYFEKIAEEHKPKEEEPKEEDNGV